MLVWSRLSFSILWFIKIRYHVKIIYVLVWFSLYIANFGLLNFGLVLVWFSDILVYKIRYHIKILFILV